MSAGYQIKEQGQLHYLTLQVMDWIDWIAPLVYRENFI